MRLYIFVGFNNYYNRIFKRYETEGDYRADAKSFRIQSGVNFDPNDGISTEVVVNRDWDENTGHPDYLIACNDETDAIVSRWFILEAIRTRKNQFRLILRRDVLADSINSILDAAIFVQRGKLSDDDPFIFNDEGMNLNKIKQSEKLLKDEFKTPWLVGYFAENMAQQSLSIGYQPPSDYYTTTQVASITGIPQSDVEALLSGQSRPCVRNWQFIVKDKSNWANVACGFSSDLTRTAYSIVAGLRPSGMKPLIDYGSNSSALKTALDVISSRIITDRATMLSVFETTPLGEGTPQPYSLIDVDAEKLRNITKPIYYNGKYLRIANMSYGESSNVWSAKQELIGAVLTMMQNTGLTFFNDGQWALVAAISTFSISTKEVPTTTGTIKVGGSTAKGLDTRQYKMFAIPLYDIECITDESDPNSTITSQGAYAMAIAKELMIAADANIYDVQLLPYCPIRERKYMSGTDAIISVDGFTEHADYEILKTSGNDPLTLLFYCERDSDSFSITENYAKESIDTSKKYDSNAKMLRLCSPNYQGSFDFNVAKNNGVDGYVVNFTYKPFTPFIRVAPIFGGLYGREFNDQRGLICGGNFSITRASSAWSRYELENKNYQNIFNRDISSLDLAQTIQMRDQMVSAITGTVQQGVQGAQIGGMIGGPWGAVAGAVIGTGVGAIGGHVDATTTAAVLKDQRSLAIDKYNYKLGNIKALPYTLTKVDAFDVSSKIWPFVEEYGPTEREKLAFLDKIDFESMTVMRIGQIQEFMYPGETNYFKGELIRDYRGNMNGLYEDYHYFNEVNAELLKGVYI